MDQESPAVRSGKKAAPAERFKTALVLSGGSARALAHIGVLHELAHRRFRPDLIVGTSMGAIIGALFAHYGDPDAVEERLRALFDSDLFRKTASLATEEYPEVERNGFFSHFTWFFKKGVFYTQSLMRPALVSEEVYFEIMSELLPDVRIEQLATPFAAIAMDLMTGEEVVLKKGSLRRAVAASAAIPGFLPAVEMHGRTLTDGGWSDNVPVAPAIALGAHFVLAVDTTLDASVMAHHPQSAMEILFRCNEITRIQLTGERSAAADVSLVPRVGEIFWADFRAIDRCIEAGRKAVLEQADLIDKKMRMRRLASLNGLRHPARGRGWSHQFIIH